MIWLLLFWIGCGVLSYGTSFAYWQLEWPALAKKDYGKDMRFSVVVALVGPISLGFMLLATEYSFKKHGLKWK